MITAVNQIMTIKRTSSESLNEHYRKRLFRTQYGQVSYQGDTKINSKAKFRNSNRTSIKPIKYNFTTIQGNELQLEDSRTNDDFLFQNEETNITILNNRQYKVQYFIISNFSQWLIGDCHAFINVEFTFF